MTPLNRLGILYVETYKLCDFVFDCGIRDRAHRMLVFQFAKRNAFAL